MDSGETTAIPTDTSEPLPEVGTFRPWVLAAIVVTVGLAVAKPYLLGEPPRVRSSFAAEDFMPPALPYAGARRIGLMEAKQAFDAGAAVFLDVRSVEDFRTGHLPGAVSMPVDDVELRFGELNPNLPTFIYCA